MMAQIDTRHAEKERYFDLLMVQAGEDVNLMINRLTASMEPEDIKQVEEAVAQYLKQKAAD